MARRGARGARDPGGDDAGGGAPGSRLGEVGRAGAAATGLAPGTPVLAGMTDGCAGQIAAGALEVGAWNSVLGTTLVLKGVTAELLADPAGIVYSHRSPDGPWLPGGASSAGAGVLSGEFGGRDLAALDALAAGREPSGAVVYPLVLRPRRALPVPGAGRTAPDAGRAD